MQLRIIQQTMLRLALVAALLMTLMPSLMRLSGHAHSGHEAFMSSSVMHSMHDMPAKDAAHAHLGRPSFPHGGVPGLGDDNDCAYCPLLASLALLAFVLLVLPLQRAPDWVQAYRALAPRLPVRHPCGLGSRGPPLAA